MQAKLRLMKEYPDMGSFVLKAFYEKEPEVCSAVQESYKRYFNLKANRTLINLDPEQFIPGLDIKMMYKDMYWACEGYLWEITQRGEFDVEKLEKDFIQIIEFWKSIYLRKE